MRQRVGHSADRLDDLQEADVTAADGLPEDMPGALRTWRRSSALRARVCASIGSRRSSLWAALPFISAMNSSPWCPGGSISCRRARRLLVGESPELNLELEIPSLAPSLPRLLAVGQLSYRVSVGHCSSSRVGRWRTTGVSQVSRSLRTYAWSCVALRA